MVFMHSCEAFPQSSSEDIPSFLSAIMAEVFYIGPDDLAMIHWELTMRG